MDNERSYFIYICGVDINPSKLLIKLGRKLGFYKDKRFDIEKGRFKRHEFWMRPSEEIVNELCLTDENGYNELDDLIKLYGNSEHGMAYAQADWVSRWQYEYDYERFKDDDHLLGWELEFEDTLCDFFYELYMVTRAFKEYATEYEKNISAWDWEKKEEEKLNEVMDQMREDAIESIGAEELYQVY